ncbi:uncharacterized protein CIMG_03850 [Coccidioides immitis RS]|uniref:Uncharacterized protein n=1 Tax=Coccidioides immitis (strain RS) TaxID=246410 RepID=A0A0D8JXA9_COCIM|nr:uncharacterized protein CIMG_03850 [Coccidioides immitis RS]KJF61571.1 hypothetical protein CIMG_03850 [Coccidioides immitis RS]
MEGQGEGERFLAKKLILVTQLAWNTGIPRSGDSSFNIERQCSGLKALHRTRQAKARHGEAFPCISWLGKVFHLYALLLAELTFPHLGIERPKKGKGEVKAHSHPSGGPRANPRLPEAETRLEPRLKTAGRKGRSRIENHTFALRYFSRKKPRIGGYADVAP